MRWAVAAAIAVLCWCVPAVADDDPIAKGDAYAALALQKINTDRDYVAAMDLYVKAYELAKNPQYLLYSGIAARTAELPHEAVIAYRRYLAAHGATADPALKKQIEGEIAVLVETSATIEIRTDGAPAAISISFAKIGVRPVGVASKEAPLVLLLQVGAGRTYSIVAHRDGLFDDGHAEVSKLAAGQKVEIAIEPAVHRTTATLRLTSVPSGARLSNAKLALDTLAPASIDAPAGSFEIVARLAGFADRSENIVVKEGEDKEIVFRLAESPSWFRRNRLAIGVGVAVVIVAAIVITPLVVDFSRPEAHVIKLD